MGALQHFCLDPAVVIHIKYFIYSSIPVNLIFLGYSSWSSCEALLKKLEVFFYRGIRRILGIKIQKVIDKHITNKSVCEKFNNIPCLCFQITKRQLTFLGKIVRKHDCQIPTQFLTAWCNHPQRRGDQPQINKKNL